jgi:asparagine synthase (glutamine-hydrolysing)
MRDKWILRKVADRYMPKILSQRKKLPFNVNAYERIKIPASYFRNSYFSEYSGLVGTDLDYLLDRLDQTLRVKLLMLDVWGRVCIRGEDAHHVSDSLRAQLSF